LPGTELPGKILHRTPHTEIIMRSLMLAATFLLSPSAILAQFSQPPIAELRRALENKERELGEVQLAVTSARARLAKAEGKLELAASEWRRVLSHHENELKKVQGLLAEGRICFDGPIREAEGMVAIARVWLAEVENRSDISLVELPKVVDYYEYRIRMFEALRSHNAVTEKEATASLKELREELVLARERLSSLRDRR
jgi:hypothetical protein